MDFADEIRALIGQLDINKDKVATEEATKQSLVLPFLQVLGYKVFDPSEVIPEFTADIGIKKGEKVDYAIAFNNEPTILIEVKTARSGLQPTTANQLLRYFGVTKAAFAILTNGIQYQFFCDLVKKNVMDTTPFLTVDLVPSIRDSEIRNLRMFHKTYFKADQISSSAIELKYKGELKNYLKDQIKSPDESFVRFLIKVLIEKKSFTGIVTKQSVDRFSPIVVGAFSQFINEMVTDITNRASEEAKKVETGEVKEGLTEKQILRQRFWTQLLGYAKTKTDLHARISPTEGGWVGRSAGIRGLGFCYSVTKHQATAELYIDRGDKAENEKIFDKLMAAKTEVERGFGGPMEWERLEGKRACRIKKTIADGGYLDEPAWPKVQELMVEAMMGLEKGLNPHIQNIKGELE